MKLGIALCFDLTTELALKKLMASICSPVQGDPVEEYAEEYARPHVTLAVVRGGSSEELKNAVKNFAATIKSFQGDTLKTEPTRKLK